MNRTVLAFAALAAASFGCASEKPASPLAGEPPELDAYLEKYEARGVCAASGMVKPDYVRLEDDLRPYPVAFCAPSYPAVLTGAGYQAVCKVSFTVKEDGVPVTHGADCAVTGGDPAKEQWNDFAKKAFEGAAQRAVSRMVFATPENARAALSPETVFVQPVRFVLAD
jgi:hypothetical protein